MMDDSRLSWLDDAPRRRIAIAIRDYLSSKGLSRKDLVRHDMSISTINKALAGLFTKQTLTKIESILDTKFYENETRSDEAHQYLGRYSRHSVDGIIGSYVCFRQAFDDASAIVCYRIDVSWSKEKQGLVFSESQRYDPKYTQSGMVYVSQNLQFFSFLTVSSGNVRSIILNRQDPEGVCRGILSTVFNVKGALFVPVATPIVICKDDNIRKENCGIISRTHPSYEQYHSLLTSVTIDEFALILHGPSSNNKRTGLSVVG